MAKNGGSGNDIMELLLNKDIPVIEDAVKEIAKQFDREAMTLLLEKRGQDPDHRLCSQSSSWELAEWKRDDDSAA